MKQRLTVHQIKSYLLVVNPVPAIDTDIQRLRRMLSKVGRFDVEKMYRDQLNYAINKRLQVERIRCKILSRLHDDNILKHVGKVMQ